MFLWREDYLERFNRAKLLIKEKLGLDTRW